MSERPCSDTLRQWDFQTVRSSDSETLRQWDSQTVRWWDGEKDDGQTVRWWDGEKNDGQTVKEMMVRSWKRCWKRWWSDSKGSDSRGSDDQGSDSRGSDGKGSDGRRSDDRGSNSKGSDSKMVRVRRWLHSVRDDDHTAHDQTATQWDDIKSLLRELQYLITLLSFSLLFSLSLCFSTTFSSSSSSAFPPSSLTQPTSSWLMVLFWSSSENSLLSTLPSESSSRLTLSAFWLMCEGPEGKSLIEICSKNFSFFHKTSYVSSRCWWSYFNRFRHEWLCLCRSVRCACTVNCTNASIRSVSLVNAMRSRISLTSEKCNTVRAIFKFHHLNHKFEDQFQPVNLKVLIEFTFECLEVLYCC